MIESTRDKVSKILNEIENSDENKSSIDKKEKSIDEVIKIMLDNVDEKSKKFDNPSNTIDNSSINTITKSYIFDMEELTKWKNNNNNIYTIMANWVFRSNRKIIGKFIIFGKRAVRKLLRWYIEPIVEQQNKFNGSITASINALYNNEIVTKDFIDGMICNEKIHKNEMLEFEEKIDNINKTYSNRFEELNLDKIFQSVDQLESKNYEIEQALTNLVYKKEIEDLEETINSINLQLENKNSELEQSLNINEHKISALEQMIDNIALNNHETISKLRNENSMLKDYIIDELNRNNQLYNIEMQNVKDKLETDIDYLDFKIAQFNNSHKTPSNDSNTIVNDIGGRNQEPVNSNTYEEINYFKFENNFRGTRNSIKNFQLNYINYYIGKDKIIDVGCGRGEFLELLKEHNISAIGVDLYEEFVEYCKHKGLNAVYGDGIKYIQNLDNESIEGIFASQVAEHLQTEQLVTFCNESYKKLKTGCYFIMETPNPTSLSIYMNAFYIDPSHVKPVHPKTLEFLLKEAGFRDIRIEYTEASKPKYKLPLLNAENITNLSEFNDGINLLSDIIFGSQDYAIIAKK